MNFAAERLGEYGIPTRDMTKRVKARRGGAGLQALARGSLAIARSHASEVLTSIEEQLEKELQRDAAAPPRASLAKVRHKGKKFLHSKHVLLIVVALNVLDCILVLGELILDIHYVVDLLDKSDKTSTGFLNNMQQKYHETLPADVHDIQSLYSSLLRSHIIWVDGNRTHPNVTSDRSDISHGVRKRSVSVSETHPNLSKGYTTYSSKEYEDAHVQPYNNNGHTLEEDLAHAFHKASITILAILVVETLIKMLCEGRHIFHRKFEIFDGVVVLASFIMDVIFIKGLTSYQIKDYVFILAFLVPWRVIRVVNSLIVAVMDHATFRLKLLYSQKKQISHNLKQARNEIQGLKNNIAYLKKIGKAAGIPDVKMERYLTRDVSFENSLVNVAAISVEKTGGVSWNTGNGVSNHTDKTRDSEDRLPEEDEYSDLMKGHD